MRSNNPAWLPDRYLPPLTMMSALFIIGMIAGCVCAIFWDAGPPDIITPGWEVYFKLLWEYGKYPFIAYVCGFSSLGVAAVPLLVAARGFTVSVFTTGVVRLYGLPGLQDFIASHGILSITCTTGLLILAIQGFNASKFSLAGAANRRRGPVGSARTAPYNIRFIICAAAAATACALDIMLYPTLASVF